MTIIRSDVAEELTTTVRAGHKNRVYNGATYNRGTCNQGVIPDFKVRRKPKHGNVNFGRSTVKLGKNAGKCQGKVVKGGAIYYTPDRDFRGVDTFTVGFTYFSYDVGWWQKHRAQSFRVTVK